MLGGSYSFLLKRGEGACIVIFAHIPENKAVCMPYDLSCLKLLARGGQADIYEIDESRILRVLRNPDPEDFALLMNERAPEDLMKIRKRVDILINRSAYLDSADRAFVRELLAELPEGGSLLHGDFHPGNILTDGGRAYIIDWFAASGGDAVSDIAHTYLLCACKPRIPSESAVAHRFTKAMAVLFGRMGSRRSGGIWNYNYFSGRQAV